MRQQDTSHTPPTERDEWRTPPWLFQWLYSRFAFAIDLAASASNLMPAYISRIENSLVQRWSRFGWSGFLNPPYSDIDPWMAKAVDEARDGFTTVMLVPAPNGEDRYGRYVFGVASELIHITGRIDFLRPGGTPVSGNTRGSCIVVYRGHDLGHTRHVHIKRDEIRRR